MLWISCLLTSLTNCALYSRHYTGVLQVQESGQRFALLDKFPHENPWNVSFSVARFDPLPSRFEWMNSSGIIKMMDSVLLCEALSAHMLLRTTKGAVWLRGQKLQQFLACTENHHHKDYSGWHAQESSHKILIIIFLAVFSRPATLQVQHLQPVSSAAIFTPPILYTLRLLLPDLIL